MAQVRTRKVWYEELEKWAALSDVYMTRANKFSKSFRNHFRTVSAFDYHEDEIKEVIGIGLNQKYFALIAETDRLKRKKKTQEQQQMFKERRKLLQRIARVFKELRDLMLAGCDSEEEEEELKTSDTVNNSFANNSPTNDTATTNEVPNENNAVDNVAGEIRNITFDDKSKKKKKIKLIIVEEEKDIKELEVVNGEVVNEEVVNEEVVKDEEENDTVLSGETESEYDMVALESRNLIPPNAGQTTISDFDAFPRSDQEDLETKESGVEESKEAAVKESGDDRDNDTIKDPKPDQLRTCCYGPSSRKTPSDPFYTSPIVVKSVLPFLAGCSFHTIYEPA
eukprot:gene14741-31331_t